MLLITDFFTILFLYFIIFYDSIQHFLTKQIKYIKNQPRIW